MLRLVLLHGLDLLRDLKHAGYRGVRDGGGRILFFHYWLVRIDKETRDGLVVFQATRQILAGFSRFNKNFYISVSGAGVGVLDTYLSKQVLSVGKVYIWNHLGKDAFQGQFLKIGLLLLVLFFPLGLCGSFRFFATFSALFLRLLFLFSGWFLLCNGINPTFFRLHVSLFWLLFNPRNKLFDRINVGSDTIDSHAGSGSEGVLFSDLNLCGLVELVRAKQT